VLDVGSGPGFLTQAMAEIVGPSGLVRGVDISPEFVRRAAARNACSWLSYAEGDATALPEPDRSFDVVVSTQVAEYVPDIDRSCTEAFRVLKSGGRGVILATDWRALAWNSDDPARMRRVLDAFAPHCADSVLPRTLAPCLRRAGFDVARFTAFPILNLDWADGSYSRMIAPFVSAYIRKQGTLPEAELAAWEAELETLAAEGRYYFLSNRIFFEVQRPPAR
jgi:SAM-dependent methyltransferase